MNSLNEKITGEMDEQKQPETPIIKETTEAVAKPVTDPAPAENKDDGKKITSDSKDAGKNDLDNKAPDKKNADAKSTEKNDDDKKDADAKSTEKKDPDKKDTDAKDPDKTNSDDKTLDKKDADAKSTEKKDTDKKDTDAKSMEKKDADKKDTDAKSTDKKDPDKKDVAAKDPDKKDPEPVKKPALDPKKLGAVNLKVAGKWGAALEKTKKPSAKRRPTKSGPEVDPFLAKFAMANTRRNAMQKTPAADGKAGDKPPADDDDDEEEEEEKCWKQPCCTWPYWRDYVIDPAEPLWFYWSLIASLAVFYNLVCVFLRAVWVEMNMKEWEMAWFILDYTSDFITILDMFVRCRLGFLEQGILVTEKKRLVKVYIKSPKFFIDIFSILPFDLFYLLTGLNTLFRMNRIVRIWRVLEFYHDSETRTTFPNGFRMIFLVISICLMIHWNACIYYSMSKALGFGSDEWTYDPNRPGFSGLGMRYLFSFYWSMLTLTAIGDTNPPESMIAMMYCVCVTLCGVLIFATIFGNVGAMINQMNASRQEFQQNVDAVKRYMDIRKVSPVLQDRVIQWFAYTWNNKQSVDDKEALLVLPEKLRAEIAIQVHLQTLKKVGIFKDCEPGLLQELVLKLRLQVFSPGDYICRKGDIGKEMYIIKRGKLQVVSPDGKIVFVTLQDGAVFGEVSILNIAGNKTGNRRTASVRSMGYSDLFCLSKDDLWDALKEYPDAKLMLSEIGKQILRKDNLLDEEAARRKELEEMSMDTKIDHINTTMESIGKQVGLLATNILDLQKHLGVVDKQPVEEDKKPEGAK
ncbi:cyclic nucleotide-gated cation channel alpha-3 [Patella vulgata]|uniref:cyclic nucleotide-gated cation channel alpha-3 n=1 Tax=Patella vulgata TaxID=6465 RepID=UPI0024A978D3|nr:cyclic nucleotide-gated cation channel alpha-3 [Patella vulgata]